MKNQKIFISHASEDKADFVEPLVYALKQKGFEVWYDKFSMTLGDSLLQKISEGLRDCDYGVVVLSSAFFKKKWPRAELDGLFALETAERKIILPIWKDVTEQDVRSFSPILAGRLGAPTNGGVEPVVEEICRAVEAADRVASFSNVENAISLFKALDKEVLGTKRADELARSVQGVQIIDAAAKELIVWLRNQIQRLTNESETLRITLANSADHLSFSAPYAMQFLLRYENGILNSISTAVLRLLIYQWLDSFREDYSKRDVIRQEDFEPRFHHTGKIIWRSTNTTHEYTTEQLQSRVLEEIVISIRHLHEKAMAKKAR